MPDRRIAAASTAVALRVSGGDGKVRQMRQGVGDLEQSPLQKWSSISILKTRGLRRTHDDVLILCAVDLPRVDVDLERLQIRAAQEACAVVPPETPLALVLRRYFERDERRGVQREDIRIEPHSQRVRHEPVVDERRAQRESLNTCIRREVLEERA